MSDSSVIVTGVFKTIALLRKYFLYYYWVYVILLAAKHFINGLQCCGHLGVPKIAAGHNLGFLNLKVSPLDALSLKSPC